MLGFKAGTNGFHGKNSTLQKGLYRPFSTATNLKYYFFARFPTKLILSQELHLASQLA